jgi:hypothetical protein
VCGDDGLGDEQVLGRPAHPAELDHEAEHLELLERDPRIDGHRRRSRAHGRLAIEVRRASA